MLSKNDHFFYVFMAQKLGIMVNEFHVFYYKVREGKLAWEAGAQGSTLALVINSHVSIHITASGSGSHFSV